MNFTYEVSGSADRYLRRLPRAQQQAIVARIWALCEEPFTPPLSKALHGEFDGVRSSKVGQFRVLYTIDSNRKLLTILRVGPRGDVYKQ